MPAVKTSSHPLMAVVPATAATAVNGHPAGCLAAAPRGRPSWSGLLRISLVAVPVRAYPAVSSTSASHFHFLHADCGQRITYHKHCPRHGTVSADAIVRGYEHASDQYVIVEPQELEKLRPARDKALVLEQCVSLQDVDPTFFAGRSLYLLPDGAAAQHPYGVLVEALQQAGKGALGCVVLSSQRQLVLVRPCGRLLVLEVLHYPAQVRAAAVWQADLAPSAATDAERELARQLIALASGPVDWARYRDTNAEELAVLVQAQIARQPPAALAEEPVLLPLLQALQQSVAAARDGSAAAAARSRKPRARRKTG
jgi:DNA end-binding protein Ku